MFWWEGEGGLRWGGWALIRGGVPINFFCLWNRRLFEVGANLRLGANLNKYSSPLLIVLWAQKCAINLDDTGITAQNLFDHAIYWVT